MRLYLCKCDICGREYSPEEFYNWQVAIKEKRTVLSERKKLDVCRLCAEDIINYCKKNCYKDIAFNKDKPE